MIRLSILITLCCCSFSLAQRQEPDAATLKQWVSELGAKSFEQRELATEQLFKAGAVAIPFLEKGLANDAKAEAVARILHVMQRLVLRGDLRAQQAARLAIERATQSGAAIINSRAAVAYAKVNEHRNQRATLELMRLGARFEQEPLQVGRDNRRIIQVNTLSLDENWIGKKEDLIRLSWLTNVQRVKLTGKTIKGSWLPSIVKIPNLRVFSLSDCEVTEQDLEAILKVKTLTFVDLRYIPVSDAFAVQLGGMEKLTDVNLYGTQVTEVGATRLQRALGPGELDFRRGAFLGVGCDSPPLPCKISTVRSESGAARAGLQIGDFITKFDGNDIRTFDDLRGLISKKIVGDTAKIEVTRPTINRRVATIPAIRISKTKKLGLVVEKHVLGLRVVKAEPDSWASDLKIKPGSIITTVQGKPVSDPKDLNGYDTGEEGTVFGISYFAAKKIAVQVKFGSWRNFD